MTTDELNTHIKEARAAFVTLKKQENNEGFYKQSLAKRWCNSGFKDYLVDKEWQTFCKGWIACLKNQSK